MKERRVDLIIAKRAWYVGGTYDPVKREVFIFLVPVIGILIRLNPADRA